MTGDNYVNIHRLEFLKRCQVFLRIPSFFRIVLIKTHEGKTKIDAPHNEEITPKQDFLVGKIRNTMAHTVTSNLLEVNT